MVDGSPEGSQKLGREMQMLSSMKMIQFIIGNGLSIDGHAYKELRDGPKLLFLFPFQSPLACSSSSLMSRREVSSVHFYFLLSLPLTQGLTSFSRHLVCHHILAIKRGVNGLG